MNRRYYLTAIGFGLVPFSGCLGGDEESSETTTRHSLPRVEVNADPIPQDWNVSIEVSVAQQYSVENPAQIRIQFTNEASEVRQFSFGPVVPFGNLYGEHTDKDEEVYLVPQQDTHIGNTYAELVPDSANGMCWRPESNFIVHPIKQNKKLRPDESCTGTYALLAGEEGICLRAGTYKFEREEYTNNRRWGFDVTLNY